MDAMMSDFYDRFGITAQVEASAPGRVNLIGDHTDYNDGFVLPLALPQVTTVEMTPCNDDQVVVTTLHGTDQAETCRYRLGEERPQGTWGDHVQGMTRLLHQERRRIKGFQALIRSRVPMGSGLSSSAALQVALLRALRLAFRLDLDDRTIAEFGHHVETQFVGAPAHVGIVDLLACSIGQPDAALFLDARDRSWRHVPLPDTADLIVIHSGIGQPHADAYRSARQQECAHAAAALGVASLRDLGLADLACLDPLPDIYRRRARHVISENARVLAAVSALLDDDIIGLGSLLLESHRSMRDDYQITVPEIDLLVDLLRFEPSIYGARMTGGGCGGPVVALAEPGRGGIVARKIARRYAEQSGRQPAIVLPAHSTKAPAGTG
jgi:galactokinase